MLSVLTVNRSFMRDFMDAETPCGALGLVEENGRQSGFVALHLNAGHPLGGDGQRLPARAFPAGQRHLRSDPPCLRILWISGPGTS